MNDDELEARLRATFKARASSVSARPEAWDGYAERTPIASTSSPTVGRRMVWLGVAAAAALVVFVIVQVTSSPSIKVTAVAPETTDTGGVRLIYVVTEKPAVAKVEIKGNDDVSEEDIKNVVWQQLKTCYDPEIPVNIVDLGLVYECEVSKNEDATRTVDIKMTLTAPGCGMGEVLVQDVRDKVQIVPTVARANVELVFDPPWNQTMMSDEARLQTGMM